MTLILFLGFTFFAGQPNWFELDTRDVVWTVSDVTSQAFTDTNVLGVPSSLTYHQQEEN